MMMKCLTLALVLVTCSSLKISPFVPREITKREVDIARTQFQLHRRDHSASELGIADSDITPTYPPTTKFPGDTDDTVPIVVGCMLAGLIGVVMVSYFVLRARANRK